MSHAICLFLKLLLLGFLFDGKDLSFRNLLGFLFLSFDGVNLLLLATLDFGGTSHLWVFERCVVQLLGGLDQLHGYNEVLVLLFVDGHVTWALGVVDEGALDEGNLDGARFNVVVPQLGKVKLVGVLLRLVELEARAFCHGRGADAAASRNLALIHGGISADLADEIVGHFLSSLD